MSLARSAELPSAPELSSSCAQRTYAILPDVVSGVVSRRYGLRKRKAVGADYVLVTPVHEGIIAVV